VFGVRHSLREGPALICSADDGGSDGKVVVDVVDVVVGVVVVVVVDAPAETAGDVESATKMETRAIIDTPLGAGRWCFVSRRIFLTMVPMTLGDGADTPITALSQPVTLFKTRRTGYFTTNQTRAIWRRSVHMKIPETPCINRQPPAAPRRSWTQSVRRFFLMRHSIN
jgi:hypothetical protein